MISALQYLRDYLPCSEHIQQILREKKMQVHWSELNYS